MRATRKIRLPDEGEALASLRAGEEVLLSGTVLTMRDAALERLASALARGEEPPVRLAGQVIFHAGPAPAAAGRPTGAVGPTTSARMDRFLPMLFDLGVVATIGKGPRTAEAAADHSGRGVYLAAVGGLGALYGGMVRSIRPVAWEDLGPEAVYEIALEEFPALVAIDSRGVDHLRHARETYRRSAS